MKKVIDIPKYCKYTSLVCDQTHNVPNRRIAAAI